MKSTRGMRTRAKRGTEIKKRERDGGETARPATAEPEQQQTPTNEDGGGCGRGKNREERMPYKEALERGGSSWKIFDHH